LDVEVVDGWAAERKPVQKGVDTHRAVARWFYERVGRKCVREITRADVLSFKAKLIAEGATPANIRVKLSRLRTLLQWAADNDLAVANVAKGIGIKDTAQAQNRRREFDLESLRRIFASPVFASNERPAGGKGEAAYWLPILALYTGARLEELGQLRQKDVQLRSYVDEEGQERTAWVIHIVSDPIDGLALKNAVSERIVPVHTTLERLGFIEFVRSAKDRNAERIFDLLRPNVYGRLTAKWGEWFGAYLRTACCIPDRRLVFHSFRHSFKQFARHAGINEGVQRQLMGHSSGDAADHYGSGFTVHQLVEGMKMYAVPGLSLPPPEQRVCVR
jgi:integrase